MMPDMIDEIRALLPLTVDECRFEDYALHLSGTNWRLRASGPWRLIRGGAIETSSGAELRPDMAGKVMALVGLTARDIEVQSKFAALDIALVFADERVLELFSENIYDDWLLTINDIVIEGPVHAA